MPGSRGLVCAAHMIFYSSPGASRWYPVIYFIHHGASLREMRVVNVYSKTPHFPHC